MPHQIEHILSHVPRTVEKSNTNKGPKQFGSSPHDLKMNIVKIMPFSSFTSRPNLNLVSNIMPIHLFGNSIAQKQLLLRRISLLLRFIIIIYLACILLTFHPFYVSRLWTENVWLDEIEFYRLAIHRTLHFTCQRKKTIQ